MNTARITITYPDQPAYTIAMRSFNISNPFTASITSSGQIIKSGLDGTFQITGTCTLTAAVYEKLRNGFLLTWNNNKIATLIAEYSVPGVLEGKRTFNKAVVSVLTPIENMEAEQEVLCNITVECREEEGVNDFFGDPLIN